MVRSEAELKAKDVMTVEPVCVEPSTMLRELARVFESNEISGAPVIDAEGRVVGVVSKTDLIHGFLEGTEEIPPAYLFEALCEQGDPEASEATPESLIMVEDIMTEDVVMVGPEEPIDAIARLMWERRIHRVIVADAERFPLGIITSLDLLGGFPRAR